jgi:hypothetical protein
MGFSNLPKFPVTSQSSPDVNLSARLMILSTRSRPELTVSWDFDRIRAMIEATDLGRVNTTPMQYASSGSLRGLSGRGVNFNSNVFKPARNKGVRL